MTFAELIKNLVDCAAEVGLNSEVPMRIGYDDDGRWREKNVMLQLESTEFEWTLFADGPN
jgi:hypothetical protein